MLGKTAADHIPLLGLILEQLGARESSSRPVIEIHRRCSLEAEEKLIPDGEEFRSTFRQKLVCLRGNHKVIIKVFFWQRDKQPVHARYLLSGHVGVSSEFGMGKGKQSTDTTEISILPETRRIEEWNRYSVPSTDLKIDAATDILLIE